MNNETKFNNALTSNVTINNNPFDEDYFAWAKNEIIAAMSVVPTDDQEFALHIVKDMMNNFDFGRKTAEATENRRIKDFALFVPQFLNQLFNHNPLTALTNEVDDWNVIKEDDTGIYLQHKRRDSLFKMVNKIGPDHVEDEENAVYHDVEAYRCVDVNNPEKGYFIGDWASHIFVSLVQPEFPYFPYGQYVVYVEDLDIPGTENERLYSVVAIKAPGGDVKQYHVHNRAIGNPNDSGKLIPISKEDYVEIKQKIEEWEEVEEDAAERVTSDN